MKIHLQYGRDGLDVDVPGENVTVLRPQFVPGLADEHAGFVEAVRAPIGSGPLAEKIAATDRVAVVIADGTRALPSDRLLPWLFAELSHVPAENFTVIVGTGTHRPNTPEEIARIVGPEVAARYRVVNHNAYDKATMAEVRPAGDGAPALWMNRAYVEADRRILIGFIEPHFMAGYSGGYKAVFPGVADLASILHYHRAEMIGHPRSVWGLLDGNPTQAHIRRMGSALPVDFLLNVTLNHQQQITRFYCGDVIASHEAGCVFAKETAMVACAGRYPLVITSNSGYPLDQNLYQSVKGMCAAAEIVVAGGEIVTVARCNDGFPSHGNFAAMLAEYTSAQAMLDAVYAPGFHKLDQWQIQKLAQVLLRAKVSLYSELSPEQARQAHLTPIGELNAYIAQRVAELGPDIPIAVLPEGPMTIPYVDETRLA
ncbi:MAG: nickel-dependent lactate racemase [Chloroflexi bacterium]|nr:MAG: nickel-dependent lactate racemase [Chloroflexota bacterium]